MAVGPILLRYSGREGGEGCVFSHAERSIDTVRPEREFWGDLGDQVPVRGDFEP